MYNQLLLNTETQEGEHTHEITHKGYPVQWEQDVPTHTASPSPPVGPAAWSTYSHSPHSVPRSPPTFFPLTHTHRGSSLPAWWSNLWPVEGRGKTNLNT